MSVQLLDKTRKINKLLHNNHSHRVEFNDICEVLSGILESNILVISQKGKILGAASYSGIDKIGELITADTGGFVDNMLNEDCWECYQLKKMLICLHWAFQVEVNVSLRL